ncbi:unnamed protein product [Vitrella brassicaformis CCMP3155]|uniref:Uncharacterized protein n=1 Tax=Vitrella brassicaformis (strain CCMP3155) TaxID=1169540 RepID=A0A0G4G7L1_VITBC|nr:unnamed protein product [Vitrella brassicaformis CCMP3155]|eukprot:CEM24626.1 unnamed protein product [Vitrella brassicaformis CCMP3155]
MEQQLRAADRSLRFTQEELQRHMMEGGDLRTKMMAKQAEGYANQEAHLEFLRQQLESVQEVLKQVQQEKGAAEGTAIAARRDLTTALQDLEYFKKHAGQMGGPTDDKYRSMEQQLAALRNDNEGLQKQLAMMRQALQEKQTRVADLQNRLRMRETAPRHPELKEWFSLVMSNHNHFLTHLTASSLDLTQLHHPSFDKELLSVKSLLQIQRSFAE